MEDTMLPEIPTLEEIERWMDSCTNRSSAAGFGDNISDMNFYIEGKRIARALIELQIERKLHIRSTAGKSSPIR